MLGKKLFYRAKWVAKLSEKGKEISSFGPKAEVLRP